MAGNYGKKGFEELLKESKKIINCDCGMREKIVNEIIRLEGMIPKVKVEDLDYVDLARINTVSYLRKLVSNDDKDN